MAAQQKPKTLWQRCEPFVLGGSSGMLATVLIQPVDIVKVRIQVLGEGSRGAGASPFTVAKMIIKEEGAAALYKGLSAGLLRQATYTTTRLGLFRSMTHELDKRGKKGVFEKAVAGLIAGGIGAIVGTPSDLALIRMQTDAMEKDPAKRRNYTGVFNALVRIVKEEGFKGLFAGCLPVVVRAMSLNAGMLAGHDQVFQEVKAATGNVWGAHFAAKMTAGFLASAFSLPFDFVKTRIQKQKPGPDGKLPYNGAIDCATKVFMNEGPMAFYRGFWTYYMRIAPHAMFTLMCLDWLTGLSKKYLH